MWLGAKVLISADKKCALVWICGYNLLEICEKHEKTKVKQRSFGV